jgi:hypothetical protein
MRLGRTASLLAVFLLLTTVATATAECAWMLWAERASLPQDGFAPNGFERLAAYGDYGSCARAARAKAERQAADMLDQYPDVKVYSRINDQWIAAGTHDAINASDNRRSFSDRFMCFPDTVDPRGPKGK